MYLFDADVLIKASRHDFPLCANPGTFWTYLEQMGKDNKGGIPQAVYEEITRNDEGLATWLHERRALLFLPTEGAIPYMPAVLKAYGPLSDVELERLNHKADPYLVAHAIALQAVVVTDEVCAPCATSPLKKKIPDICQSLSVQCIRYPRFLWEANA